MATAARTPAPPAGLARDQLRELYYYLRLTRSLEERLVNLYRQGRVIGGLYRSLGQEGESVASAYALEAQDVLSPLIRNLGSMLVKGATPVQVLRQYMAKASSPTAGREMNLHFNDLARGFLGQISHLGDMVPVMAGITLSFKLRGEPRVGLVYVGDGATSTGAFHEGMNFAAVQQLPLVVIVEHNGYAYSTPTTRQTQVHRLAQKAHGYGISGSTVDGNDVLAVYEAAKHAVARARAGEGVSLLEVVTYRRKGHAEHDDQRYQAADERAAWAKNDPIDRYVAEGTEQGWLDPATIAALDDRVAAELDAAIASCENDALPEPATALDGVYAADASSSVSRPSSPLWYRRLDG